MPNQTGPRTEEGKQASSQNNRQHGFSTANIIVLPEDRPYFDQIESELRNEIQPEGPLEDFAFRRLLTARWQMEKCQQREATLVAEEPTEENEAKLATVHRYYLRWEGSYNAAFRHMKSLQTDRTLRAYNEGRAPDFAPPLAEVKKIEHFASRIARHVTFDDHVRKELNTQLAIITLERQIRESGAVPPRRPLAGGSTATTIRCSSGARSTRRASISSRLQSASARSSIHSPSISWRPSRVPR